MSDCFVYLEVYLGSDYHVRKQKIQKKGILKITLVYFSLDIRILAEIRGLYHPGIAFEIEEC